MKKILEKPIIKIYMVFAVIFGILYMLILPFPSSPDENRHFVKIYSITEGYILPSDDTILPEGLDIEDQFDLKYSKLEKDRFRKADPAKARQYDLSRTVFYFPLVYLPQTIGILTAKLFTGNIYTICLVGRIFGYMFNVFMTGAALYIIPAGENIIFLTVMNPIYMQQSVSLSGDSMVNALAVFLTAYLIALRGGKAKKLWPLFILFPMLGLCKMFYLPMLLLVFIIDENVVSDKKRVLKIRLTVIAETLVMCVLWLYIASQSTLYIADEKSGSNLEYILQKPFDYIIIIFRSCLSEGRTWIRQTFGGNLGWIAVNVFMPFIFIYIIILIYSALAENDLMKNKDRLLIFICNIVIFLLVLTTEYIQWTTFRAETIDGVQGRYFLPLIPASFLALANNHTKLPKKNIMKVICGYMIVYNIVALITVYNVFSK